MDPPYYDNVMYAELSDFFYVWLKRTAGLLYPDLFTAHLTDKDREAVANLARFAGQKGGAQRILPVATISRGWRPYFLEQRRVLKPDGIMTVMFTHKAKPMRGMRLQRGLIDGGIRDHRIVADQHRSRRKPAHSGKIRSALNNLSGLPGARRIPPQR